jgi:hypothetical protein
MPDIYKAFLSYSHAVDGQFAPALQRALQRLTKPWYRRRALRVFRDETSLAADSRLWSSIQAALASSESFILLASPRAAESRWVSDEIEYWLEHKDPARLLIALTDGEIAWDPRAGDFDWERTNAVPRVLAKTFAEEPHYVDFRWARTRKQLTLRDPEFRDRVADLAAPLHGRPKDELVGDDIRQHRRTIVLVCCMIAALTILLLAVGSLARGLTSQRNSARLQRDRANSQALAAEARLNLERRPALALWQSLQALRYSDTVEAESSLLAAVQHDPRITAFLPGTGSVASVAFNHDGRVLAGAQGDTIVLWDRRSRRPLGQPLRGHDKPVNMIAFSPDGKLVASASNDGTVILWDLERRRPIGKPLAGHTAAVTSVAFSPDGRFIVSGGGDGGMVLWDAQRRSLLGPFLGDTGQVTGLAFGREGRLLGSAGQDGRIRLWDVERRQLIGVLSRDPGSGTSVAIAPDGRTLAAGSTDGSVQIWDVGVESWRARACAVIEPLARVQPTAPFSESDHDRICG